MAKVFDPFNDRTSRDIRNALSSALVVQLHQDSDEGTINRVARHWLEKTEAVIYHDYIHVSQRQYDRVIHTVNTEGIKDTRLQSVVLWNAGLFFEMHELLETIWHGAHGDERIALKGLIQAAGAYVHQRRRNSRAAQGLARRALQNIQSAPYFLGFIRNLDHLMRALRDPESAPPRLRV